MAHVQKRWRARQEAAAVQLQSLFRGQQGRSAARQQEDDIRETEGLIRINSSRGARAILEALPVCLIPVDAQQAVLDSTLRCLMDGPATDSMTISLELLQELSLLDAIEEDDVKETQELLARRVHVDATAPAVDCTLLQMACGWGNNNCVQMLQWTN